MCIFIIVFDDFNKIKEWTLEYEIAFNLKYVQNYILNLKKDLDFNVNTLISVINEYFRLFIRLI